MGSICTLKKDLAKLHFTYLFGEKLLNCSTYVAIGIIYMHGSVIKMYMYIFYCSSTVIFYEVLHSLVVFLSFASCGQSNYLMVIFLHNNCIQIM